MTYAVGHLRLGVNIDHVATVRNARGGDTPDPLRAARIAETAGADGITAHLREDRRHISDADIEGLMDVLSVPLNFEMAATLCPKSGKSAQPKAALKWRARKIALRILLPLCATQDAVCRFLLPQTSARLRRRIVSERK